MYPDIMLRLTVENMRYQILHAFSSKSVEVEEEISKALDAVIKDFDFAAIVKAEANAAMRDAIKAAVVSACSSLMREEPIASMIKASARSKVRQAIEEAIK